MVNEEFENKYKCPCCGYLTFSKQTDNTFQICPVCYWEDDGIQLYDTDYDGGANKVSLNQARINFKKYGASEEAFIEYVRMPEDGEIAGAVN